MRTRFPASALATNKLAALILGKVTEQELLNDSDSFSNDYGYDDDCYNDDNDESGIDEADLMEKLYAFQVEKGPVQRQRPIGHQSVAGLNPMRSASIRLLMDNRMSISSLITTHTNNSEETDECDDESLGPDDVEVESAHVQEILAALEYTDPRSSFLNNRSSRAKRSSFTTSGVLVAHGAEHDADIVVTTPPPHFETHKQQRHIQSVSQLGRERHVGRRRGRRRGHVGEQNEGIQLSTQPCPTKARMGAANEICCFRNGSR